MSEIVLEFDAVWKKFQRGEIHDSLRDLLPALTSMLFSRDGRSELQEREFWALQDINFQVRKGEAWGIIGANGAGKSTILKLLSKVLKPTRGEIKIHGKVSALIEVGAGFHPDLTGRENVYLNGCILGMKRQEIARKFDEIVEFAGISEFIDTPVKRYSSGMYARLGFAVAAHVDPDILVVDEVLSVGDMEFQRKCLDRMHRLVAEGTTVIFVSHNLQAVQMLCSRALLLKTGNVMAIGTTAQVMSEYLCAPAESSASKFPTWIGGISLQGESGIKANFRSGEKAHLRILVRPSEPLQDCQLGLIVHRATDGLAVCDYNLPLSQAGPFRGDVSGGVPLSIELDMNLLRGAYIVSLHIYHSPSARFVVRADRAASFFVAEDMSWEGVAHMAPTIANGHG
ncbi:MAG TPA: ABC transporter ATP-binding protein [Candidatus Acidoferrales bacterium]|jgi:lipopolysaccharide transport system ATP-binding protein